jgi:hypothetical protein
MPNYTVVVNRLRIAELEVRVTNFADSYRNDRNSVILVPGGMGSRLLQRALLGQSLNSELIVTK